jgi:hypothetical protein
MIRQSVLALMVALATCTSSIGADLINTLGATTNLFGTGINNFRAAQSFNTTATDFIVTDVTLRMFTDATSGQFRISIYDATGAGNRPGAQVASLFSGPVANLPAGGVYQNFNLTNLNVVLNPNQRYYIVGDAGPLNSETAFVYWQYTTSPPPGSGGATSVFWQSLDGSTWRDEFVGEPQLMRVVAVPEPGTYALAGLCVLTLGVIGRRRSKRS